MKKFIIIPVTLLTFAACGGSGSTSITEELDKSWSEMSSSDQATFCLSYNILTEEAFRQGAVDRFGEDDADAAVVWAEGTCG